MPEIFKICMKKCYPEKMNFDKFTAFFGMFDLGSYWPASDNFAGGILKALLAANF